jgi:hypothetical protein
MSSIKAELELSASNNSVFGGSFCNDLLLYTTTSNQSIYIGPSNTTFIGITASNILVSGDIIPTSNIVYNLGSSNNRFKDLYLSGTTIQLGSTLISRDTMSGGVQFLDSVSGSNQSIIASSIQLGSSSNSVVITYNSNTNSVAFGSYSNGSNVGETSGGGGGWSNNGSNIFALAPSNVAIGKSNAGYALDVVGDINFSGILRQSGVAYIGSQWSNNSTNVFLLGSNVGIGTSNPSERLDIRGANAKFGCNAYVMNNLGIGKSNPIATLDVNGTFGLTGAAILSNTLNVIGHITASSNVVVMGNVGINNSNPQTTLDIIGTTSFRGPIQMNNTLAIKGLQVSMSDGTMTNITTSSVQGLSNDTAGMILSVASNNTNTNFRFVGNTTEIVRITGSGNVGIGTTTPAFQLDLSTDNARKSTTTTWLTSSDERVKVNIENADLDICYSNIKSINLKRFQWNSNFYPNVNDRNVIGWIAQDVQLIYPNSIRETEEFGFSNFLSLDTDIIVKTMYGALRKTIDIVEAQAITISNLESRINLQ